MSGFDINRIVDCDERFAKTIECEICLNILNDPLMTKCGHNYCHQCLKHLINTSQNIETLKCPKCREPFTSKRTQDSTNDNMVLIESNSFEVLYVFNRNLILKEII